MAISSLSLASFSFRRSVFRASALARLVAVGRIELAQIARHTLFELRPSPLHLAAREVPVAIVHRLELAAVDRHACCRQKTHLTAQFDEAGANLADGLAVVFAEVGDHLVIRHKSAEQPHHLDIAACLALQTPARLHAIQIPVDVELQQS